MDKPCPCSGPGLVDNEKIKRCQKLYITIFQSETRTVERPVAKLGETRELKWYFTQAAGADPVRSHSPVLTQRPHEAGLGHQDSLCLETANLLASAGSGIYEDLYDGRKKIKCERKWPRNAEIEMKD